MILLGIAAIAGIVRKVERLDLVLYGIAFTAAYCLLALAALSISHGALFPPNDPTGLEVEMSRPPTQIVVVGAGHWQGEGMALVEAIE